MRTFLLSDPHCTQVIKEKCVTKVTGRRSRKTPSDAKTVDEWLREQTISIYDLAQFYASLSSEMDISWSRNEV